MRNNRLLFLPAILSFLIIPYGYFTAWVTELFGDFFFFGFALAGLLFYGIWWVLAKLCAALTQRPLLSMLLLNTATILLFIPVLLDLANSGFLFTAALPVISIPVVMLPQVSSNALLYLLGLVFTFAFSFLGCASARKKS